MSQWIKKVLTIFIVLTVTLSENFAFSKPQKELPIEEIEKIEKMNDLANKLEMAAQTLQNFSEKFLTQCLKSFGNKKFCQCLQKKKPTGGTDLIPYVDFLTYIKVAITPKEELGYPKMNKEDQGLIDIILKAREECISK